MLARALVKRAFFSAACYSGMNWVLRRTRGIRAFLTLCYYGVAADDHPDDHPKEGLVAIYTRALRRCYGEIQGLGRCHSFSTALDYPLRAICASDARRQSRDYRR